MMKNWQITGSFVILILAFLLMSGCTDTGSSGPAPGAAGTQTPQIVYVTVIVTPSTIPPVVSPVQTENTAAVQTELNTKWRQIQVVYDTFNENKNKLQLNSDDDINLLREKNIPDAIAEYQTLKDGLSAMSLSGYELKTERTILVSICDYKIKYLQGLSSAYHASQTEKYPAQTSLNEYKNAKYRFQDVRDIISVIPYSAKYWEYINADDLSAKQNIFLADQNILRMSNPVK
jgi:hypothetical protein